jgi:bifunctional enzyme CysN/CysC
MGIADLEAHRPLAFDPYTRCRGTGSFVLIDLMSSRTVAAGMILEDGRSADPVQQPPAASASRGMTIWFTGLSGSGKTTLAKAVYEKLMAANIRAELLDGDLIRKHLSKGGGNCLSHLAVNAPLEACEQRDAKDLPPGRQVNS